MLKLLHCIALGGVLIGCAGAPRPAGGHATPPSSPAAPQGRVEGDVAADTVSLDALVAEAVHKHPALQRARHLSRAMWQVPSRMGSLPDPVFSVALQNIRFDEPGLATHPMSGLQFGLVQPIPYPGKLSARRDSAEEMARATDRGVELLQAKVALDVRLAYWRLSYAEAALDITRRSERVIDTLAYAVHIRFAVGMAAQQDALQSQTAHSRLRAALRRRGQIVVSSRRVLNRAVGRDPAAPLARVASPPKVSRDLDRERLLRSLRDRGPMLAESRAALRAAGAVLDTAEQERWPDFQLGVMYRLRLASPGDMSEGADMFGVSLAVTLPVFMAKKQNAGVREARARQSAAEEQLHDVDLSSATELASAIDRVRRLDAEIRLFEREVTRQADAALDASIEDYAFARVGFVSLLQNWQADLEARLALQELRSERAQTLALIDALVGAPLPGVKR